MDFGCSYHSSPRKDYFFTLKFDYNSKQVAEVFVKNIVKLHDFPKSIVSDRDKAFTSQFWQQMFKLNGTTITTITNSYLVTLKSWCLKTLTLSFHHLYFLIACHIIPLPFTTYTDGQSDNPWLGIETHGITDIRKTNLIWLQQSNLHNSWKHN